MALQNTIDDVVDALGGDLPRGWIRDDLTVETRAFSDKAPVSRRMGLRLHKEHLEGVGRDDAVEVFKRIRDRLSELLPGALDEARLEESEVGGGDWQSEMTFMWIDEELRQKTLSSWR
jgi:hypothetical protein